MPSLVYSLCPVVLVAFVLNVFVLTICKFTNQQNETNNFKISYFLYIFYDKKNLLEFDVQTVLSYLTIYVCLVKIVVCDCPERFCYKGC
jgi:hypothetical protein